MVEVSVCIGSSCHLKGSYNVIQTFQQMIEEEKLHDKVEFKATFCMRQCSGNGVAVSVDGQSYSVGADAARDFFMNTILPIAK
ncbi:MAG: (2Fe-2S) ferredoxin domain-containing protein [Clostridiales bacterium]|nr:(2Fe-2S) ferredoxin domain-containing protein [Clostridiales bacterium]